MFCFQGVSNTLQVPFMQFNFDYIKERVILVQSLIGNSDDVAGLFNSNFKLGFEKPMMILWYSPDLTSVSMFILILDY